MGKTIGHKTRCDVTAPCHPRHTWRLLAWNDLPREDYVRRCPSCGKRWEIARTRLVRTAEIAAHEFEFVQFDDREGVA